MPAVHDIPKSLPSLLERPSAEILIFDGHCRFCLAQMRILDRLDRGGRVAFVSLHEPLVAERWPELSHDDLMRRMYLIEVNGRKHGGAAVVRYLSRKLPLLWWLAPLMHIPGSLPLWQFLYRQIAKIRYRFGRIDDCEDGTCSVHFK